MKPGPFSYDATQIASRYDAARELDPPVVRMWLDAVAETIGTEQLGLILDLGCGTGRFLVPLADRFRAEVIGLDPSATMLSIAQESVGSDPRVQLRLGGLAAYPAGRQSCDLAFLSMVYHHLPDPRATLAGLAVLLRPGGHVAIRTATREDLEALEWLASFPGALELERRRLPSEAELVDAVAAAGFHVTRVQTLEQQFAATHQENFEKLARRAISVLNMIPDEEFRAGLERYRPSCEARWEQPPPAERFHLVVGRKPEG